MKLLHIITALCSWTLAQTQSASQVNQYNTNEQINLGQIYFSDNRPSPHVQGQNKVANQNEAQDSYLQGPSENNGQFTTANQNMNFGNIDRRPIQQLNTELQPPPLNKNPDYYANSNSNNNLNLEQRQGTDGKAERIDRPFQNISLAITNFGLSLLKNIEQGGNVVVSPFSLTMLLALLQQGALGSTQQQISTALKLSPDNAKELFKQLTETIQKRNSRNILRVASNVYVADAFELNPAFKNVAIRNFGSEVTPIRFARPLEAVRKINHWVAMRTNNKIEELLPPNAVGENSQLVLINAVYFKGIWQVKFKPESTSPREFHLSNGARKVIPFMRMRRSFKVGVDRRTRAQVIILPFETEQYSLMVVLPSEATTLDSVTSTLTDSQLASYHNLPANEVDLEIPKFTAKVNTDLNLLLRKMGITNIFSQQAELSNLGTYQTFSPQVSSAYHTAMLSINEDGGTAAAASAFAVVALSYDDPSIIFKVNRPFLAVLWDNQSDLPLFMAKIQDPVE